LNDAGVKNKEGTIQHNSQKGEDVAKVAEPAVYGTLIGAGIGGGKGAAIGAAGGGLAGLVWTLLSRGSDVYLPRGTQLTMVLQRPLELDRAKLNFTNMPTPMPPRDEGPAEERSNSGRRLPLPLPF
jgi:hypothetical protein